MNSENETERRAIELSAVDLGRWVTVDDWRGDTHRGRLDGIQLASDERTRVALRISTQEPINQSDGGGFYWSTFLNERHIDRNAVVFVGQPVSS